MFVFCQCGSDEVGIQQWQGSRALWHCHACERSTWVDGFSLTRFDLIHYVFGLGLDHGRAHEPPRPAEPAELVQACAQGRGECR